ncbi:S26 family signal peptidase [Elusimicrobiota bacterium]
MKEKNLIRTICELDNMALENGHTVKFTVLSGSMKYLLQPGDVISVKRGKKISKNDIVVINDNNKFITHRIVQKRRNRSGYFYRLRGDFNLKSDDVLYREKDIFGSVCQIRRKDRIKNLESPTGVFYNMVMLYFSRVILFIKYILSETAAFPRRIHSALGPNENYLNGYKIGWRSYKDSIETDKWNKNLKLIYDLVDEYIGDKNINIADIGWGSGFSEPACYLIRNKFEVDLLNYNDLKEDEKYYSVLVAELFNILPDAGKRKEFFKKIKEIMMPGGILMLSGVKKRKRLISDFFKSLKRKIWRLVKDSDTVPEAGDRVKEGKFKFHEYTEKEVAELFKLSGFKLKDRTNNRDYFNMVLEIRE